MKASCRLLFPLLISANILLTACGGSSSSSVATTAPPAAPTGLTATAYDSYVLLNADPATDATGYNLYWSTASGVTPTSGAKIVVGSTPQAHTGLNNNTEYFYVVTAVNAGGESAASAQASATPLAVTTSADPLNADPLYIHQWHLKNTSQLGGTINEDMNVEPVWLATVPIKGEGVRIAVVDDGLEIGHEDLASNMASNELSYNYVTGSNDPTNDATDLSSGHGTAVAGIIAARDLNNIGVRGVAPRAKLVGYNFLQNSTSLNEVDAMTRNAADVSISSNSWGATDGTGELEASSSLWRTAINTGLVTGRGGKGTIYTWAAGNGRNGSAACPGCSDYSNYDGRANNRGVIAVAAVNDQGLQSYYSESGANLWVSAPGGEYCDTHTITTTDRTGTAGINTSITAGASDYSSQNYTQCMNGTSSATPGVAGVVALMLAANPTLGWRDVRIILAQTARMNNPTDSGWILTLGTQTPKYWFSHKYGFGVVDAAEAVIMAKTWPLITGAELEHDSAVVTPNVVIPDATSVGGVITSGASKSSLINVTSSNINSIEFVEITFTATNTPYSGDLGVTLESPNGTVSELAVPHLCGGVSGACTSTYSGWVFGSARHLGEAANGDWILTVKDGIPGGTEGTFLSWKLKFYGH